MTVVTKQPPLKEEEENAPAIVKQMEQFDLTKPQEYLKAANLLKKFVTDQQLTENIKGKVYAYIEAWQFLGMMFGLFPICVKVENESSYQDRHYKWADRKNNPRERKTQHFKYRATVEIRNTSDDKVRQIGVNVCTNDEDGKHDWEEYAILSMAQTRAQGKAWRLLLGWMMKAAGFEATPQEEMDQARKEFLENCPTADEKRMLITLAWAARWYHNDPAADEEKRIEALATIAGCIDYKLFSKIEARLRDLQPSISQIQNPSQKDINEHLRKAIPPDVED